MKKVTFFISLVMLITINSFIVKEAVAVDYTFSWLPSANALWYEVCWGKFPNVYPNCSDEVWSDEVGADGRLQKTLDGFKEDVRYYFIAIAHNYESSSDPSARVTVGSIITPYTILWGDFNRAGFTQRSMKTADGDWWIQEENFLTAPIWAWNLRLKGYGSSSAIPFVGDFDGDGVDDIAVKFKGDIFIDYFQNGFGRWDRVLYGYGLYSVVFVGDFDGDDVDDIAVKSQGDIFMDYSADGFGKWNRVLYGYGVTTVVFVGDFDGDGVDDIAVKSNGDIFIDYSQNGFGRWDKVLYGYGLTSIVFVGDFDGDGVDDIAAKTNGDIFIDYFQNGFGRWDKVLYGYGLTSIAFVGDFDGDGRDDIAVRIEDGTTRVDLAANGFGSFDRIIEH